MRLIDADDMRQDWLENGENECIYDTNAVLDSIDDRPTVNRWIPVTERLPEEWVEVLVFARCHPDAEGFVQTAVYIGNPGYWRIMWNASMLEYNIVTHWMPLPEEPKEDADA